MRYTHLGTSDLKISRIGLGCMSYGDPDKGTLPWVLKEDAARPFIRQALERGITYFDTANMYSDGESEIILGRALRDFARRDDVVIATKVFFPYGKDGVHTGGLSRRAIMTEIDASLKRLQTDYVDLYQIHRWDYTTPIEETLEALHDVVKMGKARYIGASSMYAWQFCQALYLADLHGWTRFVSMQNHYNLLYREEEREMLGLCRHEGIGVVPWSPLARGLLARPWDDTPNATPRLQTDPFSKKYYSATREADKNIIQRVTEIAKQRGVSQAQIALAWLLKNAVVAAPIIGATKPQHIDDAVAALSIHLSDYEIRVLEEAYTPHPIAGFDHPPENPRPNYERTLRNLQKAFPDNTPAHNWKIPTFGTTRLQQRV